MCWVKLTDTTHNILLSRSIRQGYPISSFLFHFVAEIIVFMISSYDNIGGIVALLSSLYIQQIQIKKGSFKALGLWLTLKEENKLIFGKQDTYHLTYIYGSNIIYPTWVNRYWRRI